MSTPLVQVVDEHDRPIGAATKQELWAQGLRHRVVFVMLRDHAGRVLLQKRAATLPVSPGKWAHSASGHVDEGESYETAAYRELQEELGVRTVSLTEIGGFAMEYQEAGRKVRRFVKVFGGVVAADTAFSLNPEEVSAVQWVAPAELAQRVAAEPDMFTRSFPYLVAHRLY